MLWLLSQETRPQMNLAPMHALRKSDTEVSELLMSTRFARQRHGDFMRVSILTA